MDAFLSKAGGVVDASVACIYTLPYHMIAAPLDSFVTMFLPVALLLAIGFAYYMDRRYVRRRNTQT